MPKERKIQRRLDARLKAYSNLFKPGTRREGPTPTPESFKRPGSRNGRKAC